MPEALDPDELAEFSDSQTARFFRFYPVEAARVWHAITDSDSLNIWLYPVSRVEPRLGGACSFTWGAPEDPTFVGRISRFEPFQCVRYETGSGNFIQFDLTPEASGTRLAFTQYFDPDYRHDDDGQITERHGAQTAGPGTPWRAGFLAGYHVNFWFLSRFLTEHWSEERIVRESKRCVEGTNAGEYTAVEFGEPEGEWERLTDLYFQHIADACPKA